MAYGPSPVRDPAPREGASASHLRLVARPDLAPSPALSLGIALLREGLVPADDMIHALELQARHGGRLADILLARGLIGEAALQDAQARHWRAGFADLAAYPPDPELVDQLGTDFCLREGLLPLRRTHKGLVVATAHPEEFARHRPGLIARFGPVTMALATPEQIEAALLRLRGPELDRAALLRVPEPESCRNWGKPAHVRGCRALMAGLLLATLLLPGAMLWTATLWALLTLVLATAMKTAAIFASLRHAPPEGPALREAELPVISILVPMHDESDIAARLVRRLSRLDYPRELLEILLVVEEADRPTRTALQRAILPAWMRIVTVPDGPLKTKPRAMNHALTLCRGTVIGVYDAEDAPEPDQLRRIARRFQNRPPEVACLQGKLDFYNPRSNWLSRCFTMEYAAWFRIILPGLERMGWPIPLGGTTVFFRRAALERVGAWDAFNVTEDADLGMRLARHGFRTELVETTTFEEANCRPLPWIRQRSRWLKGYFVTYAVHMRRPGLLLRQLGWWRFLGFQVFFLTTLSQYVLAPVLWSFWIVPFGLSHPVAAALPPLLHHALVGTFLFTEALLIALTLTALRLTPNRLSPLWAPVLHFYFPLGALASYKALWELIHRPFWWDKTRHGQFGPD